MPAAAALLRLHRMREESAKTQPAHQSLSESAKNIKICMNPSFTSSSLTDQVLQKAAHRPRGADGVLFIMG